ncbi:MAG: hypothetical protein ACOCX3_02140 [Chloroflexota bacterium]
MSPDGPLGYARQFISYLKQNFNGQVAGAMWYAWAMSMDDGYGLVGRDDLPLEPLYSEYIGL